MAKKRRQVRTSTVNPRGQANTKVYLDQEKCSECGRQKTPRKRREEVNNKSPFRKFTARFNLKSRRHK